MNSREAMEALKLAYTCPITMELFFEPVILPKCGHSFEKEALQNALAEKMSCPECRTKSKGNFHKNFKLLDGIEAILKLYPHLEIDRYQSPKHLFNLVKENKVDEIVRLFKTRPQDINRPIIDGKNILHLAVAEGKLDIVKALFVAFRQLNVNAGSESKQVLWHNCTPIYFAASEKKSSAEILAFLIAQGGDPAIARKAGNTPLIAAVKYDLLDRIQVLIDSKKELRVNHVIAQGTEKGYTALSLAAEVASPQTFAALLTIPNVDINVKNPDGQTPLYIVAANGNVEKTKALLQMPGVEVKTSPYPGSKTALEMAQLHGHIDVVALFTELPARLNLIRNKLKKNHVQKAAEVLTEIYFNFDFKAFISALRSLQIEYPAQYTLLHRALFPNIMASLIEKNQTAFLIKSFRLLPDQLNKPVFQFTALQLAVLYNQVPLVKALFETFPTTIDVNAKSEGPNQLTAIFCALQQNNHDLFSYLIEKGADLHFMTPNGETLLMHAIGSGVQHSIDHLIAACPVFDVNRKPAKGPWCDHTALMLAARDGSPDMVSAVLSMSHVDVNAETLAGETALHMAARRGDVDIVRSLLMMPAIQFYTQDQDKKSAWQLAQMTHPHSAATHLLMGCHLWLTLLSKQWRGKFNLDFLKELTEPDKLCILTVLENQKLNSPSIQSLFSFVENLNDSQSLEGWPENAEWLTRLFFIAHDSFYINQQDWEFKIRHTALQQFQHYLSKLSLSDQLEQLQWARSQPLFCFHRRFLSVGRTSTVREIDKSIEALKEQLFFYDDKALALT